MEGLQQQLASQAPQLFRLFLTGEAVYFAGMVVMALGLGAKLGRNPLLWGATLQSLASRETDGSSQSGVFWLGFLANVVGSLTLGFVGLYAALFVLPGGSPWLVPASLVDMGFALVTRWVFFRRFRRRSAVVAASEENKG